MRLPWPALAVGWAVLAVVLLGVAPAFGAQPASEPPATFAPAASSAPVPPVTGNVSGPSLVASSTNVTFYFNVSGGPADVEDSFEGTINWTANITAGNVTGLTVSPDNGSVRNSTAQPVHLTVSTGTVLQSVTLIVHATSSLGTSNATANFSTTFRIVLPYTLRATLVAGPEATVLPFNVTVALDGKLVSTITIPKLKPNATYALVYNYPTASISSGYHTFTLTIANPHGLVTFGNGRTVESTTFYVAPAATNYAIWYVTGTVAFFGVLFIYATRVAARRRTAGKR